MYCSDVMHKIPNAFQEELKKLYAIPSNIRKVRLGKWQMGEGKDY